MPTDKPRFSIVVTDEVYEKINDFRFDRRIKSQSKAVNELIKIGLEALSGGSVSIGPSLSRSQLAVAEKYDRLDEHGRVIIDFVLEKEHERCISAADAKMTAASSANLSDSIQKALDEECAAIDGDALEEDA